MNLLPLSQHYGEFRLQQEKEKVGTRVNCARTPSVKPLSPGFGVVLGFLVFFSCCGKLKSFKMVLDLVK